ncbi:FAD-dependent oxidoreductase [Pseudomonas sp. CCI3.2]|uniref:FAD-dependent oxidoreductase n=1 Tax=unclassified Pseudomonas TaxID=196821 RepID=UPI002AC9E943|nr:MULTISPECIES: FAD-dependent oxidoreductase [unclassified Pseudomonas]MEB0078468.1 FAD-dependent oxidoreductase [Pseudomonas sp. MH10out]MEB0103982.1 FAD-dependent oxidoreductase [Pseudomonas sp. CCI3.2]MEB0131749.1 FAD-dependent oxidoreductase [Pseudomonas sp. CCI2.4]MEB0158091.1 FAD-dependent oxidoreductase [Pseudomonas sp. AH2 (2023)]MEB0168104.1 FAD-dependent oxidoreductase [Pseudomonas sp. CCC4.4]
MKRCDVLIIGAGPTGLVLALWLSKLGIRVRIIDKTATSGSTSRALAVQARTLELYRQLDLTQVILQHGHKVPAVNLWVKGEHAAQVPFDAVGKDLTPYSFLEIFPQDQHERLLIERLLMFGVSVERQTELTRFVHDGVGVTAYLSGADGQEEVCAARCLAGCDGARSTVRKSLDIGFPGGTYQQVFYVADVDADGPSVNGELHVDLDESEFLAIFPLADKHHARLIGTVRNEHADTLTFEDVSGRAIEQLQVQIHRVNWFSTYRVHHRVAKHFRQGRAFLLGDAAHVHSPAGGQGMNTGIGDAINLAWKLAALLETRASDSLLDTYETERIGFARQLVATTDRVFSFATAEGRIAKLVRTRIAPLLIPKVIAIDAVREFIFRTISQVTLNYRGMPLSAGTAGKVHGGERLPWVPGSDNFESLSRLCWQLHVYGVASEQLNAWCKERGVPLHVFQWTPAHAASGFALNALYLLRPDTYVALAELSGEPEVLDRYFDERGIQPQKDHLLNTT